jgi:NAD(P)-dependent dehydrogenase (short-subunit alcohol dehydrogenase family)
VTIVITGGTRGIGLAIARRLAKPGVQMMLGYRTDDEAAARARSALVESGAVVDTFAADIGSIEGCRALVEAAQPITHLIHNAAMIYPTGLLDADLPRFTQAIQTNGLSLLYLVAAAAPAMPRGGSVVFITSSGAHRYQPSYAALGCGKALAESLMRYLVPELAPRGIRVNAVGPGFTDTDSVTDMVGSRAAAEKLLDRMAQRNPSGRAGRDSDYTSLVEYLISPEAEFIQGQTIQANGGTSV